MKKISQRGKRVVVGPPMKKISQRGKRVVVGPPMKKISQRGKTRKEGIPFFLYNWFMNDLNLKLCIISSEYVSLLMKIDRNVMWEKMDGRPRPYIGVLLDSNVEGAFWFIPLSSPKENKSEVFVTESPITTVIFDNEKTLLGYVRHNNMILVPEKCVDIITIPSSTHPILKNAYNLEYYNLLIDQSHFIHKNKTQILNKANNIFKNIDNMTWKYKNMTVDLSVNIDFVNYLFTQKPERLHKIISKFENKIAKLEYRIYLSVDLDKTKKWTTELLHWENSKSFILELKNGKLRLDHNLFIEKKENEVTSNQSFSINKDKGRGLK